MKVVKNQVFKGSRERESLLDLYYEKNHVSKPVLVFCHGFKGYKDWGCFDLLAETFAKAGFVFIKFNFSYNGGTTKDPIDFPDLEAFSENNFSTELDDLGVILDMLQNGEIVALEEIDKQAISLMGHSRGGGIVLLKTAQDARVYKAITLAAVADFNKWFHMDKEAFQQFKNEGVTYIENSRTKQEMPLKFQLYEDLQNNKERLDILKNAKTIEQEVLLFHGTHDATVPLQRATILNETIPNSHLEIIENADHVFGAFQPYTEHKLPEYFQKIVDKSIDFLNQTACY